MGGLSPATTERALSGHILRADARQRHDGEVGRQRAGAVMLTVMASDEEIADIQSRVGTSLCPDQDHSGGCANAWTVRVAAVGDLDRA